MDLALKYHTKVDMPLSKKKKKKAPKSKKQPTFTRHTLLKTVDLKKKLIELFYQPMR